MWPDAPADDATLTWLLDASQVCCEAYAPTLTDPLTPPANYREAVVKLARKHWTGRLADNEDNVLGFGQSYTPPAMTPEVRELLRPPRSLMIG